MLTMNNQRRKQLVTIIARITDVHSALEPIRDDEEECRDNFPANLHGSERYEMVDNAACALDNACYALDESIEYLESAIV